MSNVNSGRRMLLAATCAWVLAWAFPAAAQDPGLTQAKLAALDWLVLADADDAAGTYANASKRFRDTMALDQWAAAMKQARDQFGAAVTRTNIGAQKQEPGKDVPPGEFAIVAFRTEFVKRSTGIESLTLEREADGKWRVVGYMMR
jgi:hypothetical protein